MITTAQQDFATQLFEIGAIKFGEFKLKLHDQNPEAPLSPVYIDLRILRRFPKAKAAAIDVYQELIAGLEFDLLADIPTAATPLVSSLSDRVEVGMITPRGDKKAHGTGAKIDGLLADDQGKTAVLIDDLVTRADSKIEAAQVLLDQGVKVKDIVVLIDRQQGGEKLLAAAGFRLHSALSLNQMLDFYLQQKMISQQKYQQIKKGIEDIDQYLASN